MPDRLKAVFCCLYSKLYLARNKPSFLNPSASRRKACAAASGLGVPQTQMAAFG
jgi:hypothetical protein